MKNNLHALVVGAERLKRNPVQYLLIKIHIAHTYLDLARTTSDARSGLRSLRRAEHIAESIHNCLERFPLLEHSAIRRALAALRSRIGVLEPKSCSVTDATTTAIGIAVGLARGDMVHFFAPSKQALFAGDLLTLALRLRFMRGIHAR